MGMWDEYCLVCGGPTAVFFHGELDSGKPQPKAADYAWLEAWVGVSHTEEVIALDSDTGHGSFEPHPDEKKYTAFAIGGGSADEQDDFQEDWASGYACHVACYSLLQRELNYTLRFQDVQPLLFDAALGAMNKFAWSDYGGMMKYHEQHFGEAQLLEDGNLWMIEDPSVNTANAQRILALWRPLVHSGFRRPDADAASQSAADARNRAAVAARSGDVRCESVGPANAATISDVQDELTGLTLKS